MQTEPHIHCDICKRRIHMETERYEQDECYEIDGYSICEYCIIDYLRKNYRKELIAWQ